MYKVWSGPLRGPTTKFEGSRRLPANFGEMNLVTGCIEYDFAKLCRENEKKCGWWGDGYQEKVGVFRSPSEPP